jgi:hypothetical protein
MVGRRRKSSLSKKDIIILIGIFVVLMVLAYLCLSP